MSSSSHTLVAACDFLRLVGLGLIMLAFLTLWNRRIAQVRVVAFGLCLTVPAFIRAAIHIHRPGLAYVGVAVLIVSVIAMIMAPRMRR